LCSAIPFENEFRWEYSPLIIQKKINAVGDDCGGIRSLGQSWIVRGVAGWCRERPSLVAGPALKFSL